MVFSSLIFSFFFLPLVMIIYFLSKDIYKNYILLIASLIFYSYGEPKFVFVMIGSIGANYILAIWLSKKKKCNAIHFARIILIIDVVVNVGILFVYKYLDFSIGAVDKLFRINIPIFNIVLPIGISFFTFQSISYVIDVYRGVVEVQKNPLYLALYISFFPQLIAGPIVRYSSIEKQITNRVYSLDGFSEGARRYMLGFCKKIILANNLSVIATQIFGMDISSANPLVLWLGSVSYSLQIFYDFSGYSDMAIGLGKIFGFDFEENFNYPYVSRSVTEFWRRWHISLGQWFRDYVYIPLGGSRVTMPKHLLNMFIVWTLTGIWHGANYTFIAWGLGYFILLAIEKYLVKPEKRKSLVLRVIWQILTLLAVNFGWVIFNAANFRHGIKYCLGMLGMYGVDVTIDASIVRYLREYGFFIVAGIIFATPVMKIVKKKIESSKASNVVGTAVPIGYGILFLWAVSFIILGAHNPFIYFNF